MKLTKEKLKQIIREELGAINEMDPDVAADVAKSKARDRETRLESFRRTWIGELILKGKVSATWNPEKYVEGYLSIVKDYQMDGYSDAYEHALEHVQEKFLGDLLSEDSAAAFAAHWDPDEEELDMNE